MPFLIFNLTVFIRNEFFYYKDEHLSAKLIFTSFVVFVNGSLDTCLFLHSGCLYIQRQA